MSNKPMAKGSIFSKKYILLIAIIIIAGLAYLLRGQYLAALVNGTPISRLAVLNELEKQGGGQVLDTFVTQELIDQEAEKKNVVVSDSEVSERLKQIEDNIIQQGQTLDALLAFQGITRDTLSKNIKSQIVIEKLLADKLNYSDDELNDYIEKNISSFPEDMTNEQIVEMAKSQLSQTKFQTEAQKYLEELRTKANIMYFGNYDTSETQPVN
jgi:uncharacterized coiled-coil protein SlyX